jgi:hypothetical protein
MASCETENNDQINELGTNIQIDQNKKINNQETSEKQFDEVGMQGEKELSVIPMGLIEFPPRDDEDQGPENLWSPWLPCRMNPFALSCLIVVSVSAGTVVIAGVVFLIIAATGGFYFTSD